MPRIFISYRRADSIGITGRIYDRLVVAFGKENVFQDVEDIPFGVDFRKFLREQVAACEVVLVVIGRQWVHIQDEQGRRRLDNPADFVRIEVENALSQGKVVIPVLVDNATAPREDELPSTMQELCYRNAAVVRHNPDFDRDMSRLINAIQDLNISKDYLEVGSIRFGRATITQDPPTKSVELIPPDLSHLLPLPFKWCEVPTGKVTLEKGGYLRKPRSFDVERFWMAKYAITNKQYQVFVDAEDGYRNEKWWDYAEAAKQWRQKNPEPKITAFEGNDLPRTNVTWYEAVAFGQWVTAKLLPILGDDPNRWSREGTAEQSYLITVPTEQQWQRAAQGDDGRRYPWGNGFDKTKCNTKESGIGQVTPVTKYQDGKSPFDVMDMAGNVWEWCLTDWSTGSQLIGQISEAKFCVLRGGAYDNAANLATCGFRDYGYPDSQDDRTSFRVVAVPL
jgi:formylglycine-generating enzyme required for sulfatase activity